MELFEMLKKLCTTTGVSGEEDAACAAAAEILRENADSVTVKNGSVIGKVGNGEHKILLDAHIDQIGLIVTFITDDGFLKVGNVGGIDRRLLAAQQVTIHGKSDVCGIICSTLPHLCKDEKEVPEIGDIFIDTGMTKAQLEKTVSLGDKISFCGEFSKLLGNRVTSTSLDDRSGVAAVLYAAQLLNKKAPDGCSVYFLLSSQEEVGERGAQVAGFEIMPDTAYAVDVSFALSPGEKADKCGELSKGPMIGIAPALDRSLSDKLISLAETEKIPFQIEVMNDDTGTNADRFSVVGCGAKASTLSIPLRYMHTPVEIVDLTDVENTARLLAAAVKEGF